jgi:hypothetical protein
LSQTRFLDWRHAPLRFAAEGVAGAVYLGEEEALVLVGNLTGEARTVQGTLDLAGAPEAFTAELPADGMALVRLPRKG